MDFNFDQNIQISPDVVSRTSNDGTVIVMKMTDDDFFYKINGVAAEMWLKFSDKNANLGAVIKELSGIYGVSEDNIKNDAQVFLNRALELKLIVLV